MIRVLYRDIALKDFWTFVFYARLHALKAVGGWSETPPNVDTKEVDQALVNLGRAVARGLRDRHYIESKFDLAAPVRERAEFKLLIETLSAKPFTHEREAGLKKFFTSLVPLVTTAGAGSKEIKAEFTKAAATVHKW